MTPAQRMAWCDYVWNQWVNQPATNIAHPRLAFRSTRGAYPHENARFKRKVRYQ